MESITRRMFMIACLLGVVACDAATGATTDTPAPPAEAAREPLSVIELPPPRRDGTVSLEAALAGRASVRRFTERRLTRAELSQLLWAADGINRPSGGRTAPSAGAKYPLEIYVVTADELLHYVPGGHRVEVLAEEDLLGPMRATAQDFVADGAALFVITAVVERTTAKYARWGERFVHMEAGHAAQNVLLQAVALGLGAVPVGGFDGAAVTRTLGLPADHTPLYLVPVGEPR